MPASDVLAYQNAQRVFEAARHHYIATHTAMKSMDAVTASSEARKEALGRLRVAWEAVPTAERSGLVPPAMAW